ncbi:pilus assembly FimT family protein [Shewanella sp. TC10]|uniref:pilus assembly FimT family protein n=1 Tax=Shewanella sp. TC10 TaxID=1419739 RepID=UPI00129DDA8B|nr:prepilin-type N-terminal cleavage/methylation domain-containing protein [Shewanella sp. TC10]
MKSPTQRGFTLIELVVVIIILGILAVVAAPKFIDIKSDAVKANLSSLQGSIQSANSLVYSKAVIGSQEALDPGEIDHNGIKISTTLGYITATNVNLPKAIEGSFAQMAGVTDEFSEDWGIYNIPNSGVYIFPQGYDISSNCSLRYLVDVTNSEPVFYQITDTGC